MRGRKGERRRKKEEGGGERKRKSEEEGGRREGSWEEKDGWDKEGRGKR